MGAGCQRHADQPTRQRHFDRLGRGSEEWEATFNNNPELKVTRAEGPHIAFNGNVAWSTGIVNVVGKLK